MLLQLPISKYGVDIINVIYATPYRRFCSKQNKPAVYNSLPDICKYRCAKFADDRYTHIYQ